MQQFQTPYEVDYSRRDPAAAVDELFYRRWSPRSFKQIALPEEVVTAIFDAARWSPSCHNEQPWTFITAAAADKETFAKFVSLLVEGNRVWAQHASLLGFVIARRHFTHNGKPNGLAKFDCGAAWMALTLQARKFGLYTHGMGGILREDVYRELKISKDDFEVVCGFALGCVEVPNGLSEDARRGEQPSERKPLAHVWRRYSE